MSIILKKSPHKAMKLRAVFHDGSYVDFGRKEEEDYIVLFKRNPELARIKRIQYILSHRDHEEWHNLRSKYTWNRYIFWSEPTLKDAIKYLEFRFFVKIKYIP